MPIDGKTWLFIVPFALLLLILEELRKWLARTLAAALARQHYKASA